MSIDIIYSFMIMYCNLCYILIVWLRLVLVFLCVVTFCINISISKIPVLIYPMFPMFPNSIMEREESFSFIVSDRSLDKRICKN